MANIITVSRMLLSLALLFFPAFSTPFYVLYSAAGLTDMLDGAVARKTDSVSPFGERLDSLADLVFTAVCLIKLLPVLQLSRWMIVWACVIVLIKLINLLSGFIGQKKFVALHTPMNKLAGILVFLLPLSLAWIDLRYGAAVVCTAATFAAVQEGHFIRTGKGETA